MTEQRRLFGQNTSNLSRLILTTVLIVFCLGFTVACCGRGLSQAEAEALAHSKLQEHCFDERLEFSKFTPPKMSSEKGFPWIFDYEYQGTPHQEVRIFFDDCGENGNVGSARISHGEWLAQDD